MNRTFAIIVIYNADIEVLEKQYLSLKDQIQNIIYIDNGSENFNQLKNFTENLPSSVYFIYNSENKGLGYAQNYGIKLAIEKKASHILLLDDDSILKQGFVEALHKIETQLLNDKIKVGAVGPVYLNTHTRKISPALLIKGLIIKKIPIQQTSLSVSYLISSGSLIRTNVLEEVGLINEDLFIDGLDIEWCFRAKAHSYEIIMTSLAQMEHALGDESDGKKLLSHSPIRRYYISRNSLLFNRYKYIPLGFRIRTGFMTFVRLLLLLNNKKNFKYSLKGIADGLKGKTGQLIFD